MTALKGMGQMVFTCCNTYLTIDVDRSSRLPSFCSYCGTQIEVDSIHRKEGDSSRPVPSAGNGSSLN